MADLSRVEALIGKDNLELLKDKKVMVCGVGGVGSFVAEALARSGVGHLTLVDFDVVESSNLNRQLMSEKDNIGKPKVEAMKERLEKVSDCDIKTMDAFIDDRFTIDDDYDYVVDCIDTLTSKFILVKLCHEKDIPIICSLGSAKRINPENIRHTSLDKTRNDPLAKAFRGLVKKEGYRKKIDVVYVDTPPIRNGSEILGSTMFVAGSVGLYIASIVFEKLMEDKK